jgi:hypothetical protein
MVRQSHGSLTQVSVKDVMLFQQAIKSARHRVQTGGTLKQT